MYHPSVKIKNKNLHEQKVQTTQKISIQKLLLSSSMFLLQLLIFVQKQNQLKITHFNMINMMLYIYIISDCIICRQLLQILREYNMDLNFQKRSKFRQSIRNKAIQQFKKSKRKLFQEQYQQIEKQIQQQKLYIQIINNSSQVFQQGKNYLQLLRQTLNWGKICNYKHILPEVLLNLVKYYDDNLLVQQVIILLIQCMATIFFETTIQFDQLTNRCVIICWQLFQKYKLGQDLQKLITNRCLTTLQNITFSQNQYILHVCQELKILQNLQQMAQAFPIQDSIKLHMLGIYQNIIPFHIKYTIQKGQYLYYYPVLLKQCIQQNYNSQILNKGVQVFCGLFNIEQINKFQLIQEMVYLYFSILNAQFYVEDSQKLLMLIGESFTHQSQNQNKDIYPILINMFDLLDLFAIKYAQHVKNSFMAKSFFYLAILSTKYFQQNEQQKLGQLTKQFCNFWVNLQDDCSYDFQLFFQRFLRHSLSKVSVAHALFNQSQMGNTQNNSIGATTWQIILQFLSNVGLQQNQKIVEFLHILQIQQINEMIIQPYRNKIIQKIQGCFYNESNSMTVNRLSQNVLKLYSQVQI